MFGGGGKCVQVLGAMLRLREEQSCPGGLGACGVELEASCAEQQLVPPDLHPALSTPCCAEQ